MEEKYEASKELGSGNFGVARLVRDKKTKNLLAVKFIHRGKNAPLTPSQLAIVMEYAAGGELFAKICSAGRFSEDEARFFFQQLISGVIYCHSMEICHKDLKLENTLLDGSPTPRLKICDFGYSKIAVVWSCGVTLYVMLVGAYPFEDPEDPRNFLKTIGRIMSVQYSIPDYVRVSAECRHLLFQIFVANPSKVLKSSLMEARRITCYCDMPVVMKTVWAGNNAGRRSERCATRKCHYDIWIDEPLGVRACDAIEELVREKNQLHCFYMNEIDRLTLLMKLQELKGEVDREETDYEDDST